MAELPKLPPNILRLHSLRWDQLLEKEGFTGEHLRWHASRERRRQAARPRYSLAPPPARLVTDTTSGRRILYGTDGERAPYQKWREQEMEAWVLREDDPKIVDSIGVSETVTLAEARFSEVIVDYLKFWTDHSDPRSEEFSQWSIAIARSVIREIGELWGPDQWHAAWFERACQKKIQEALVPLTKEWACRASKLEIQSLENPHLRIESLLQADGDLNLVGKGRTAKYYGDKKFEETMKRGQEALDRSRNVLSNRKPSSDLPVVSENILGGATEDLRRNNAERFALDQKTTSDLHDPSMTIVGLPPENRPGFGLLASVGIRTTEVAMAGKTDNRSHLISHFPNRASWLKLQMLERGWSNADPSKYGGPDRKTIEKILRGEAVRNDVLEKLAVALSEKLAKISVIDIPQD